MPFSRQIFGGSPFDRRTRADSDHSFRHQLDDIAQRHPEFAEHLQSFPEANDELFRRNRPFGRFERFGFPFERDFPSDHPPASAHEQSETQPPQPTQPNSYVSRDHESRPVLIPSEKSHVSTTEANCTRSQENPPEIPIQQSNTCDFDQRQESANLDCREQRSMSAPPENSRTFKTSMHIPMDHKRPINESQPSGANSGSVERVIPIHVEGRNEPVIPKNSSIPKNTSSESGASHRGMPDDANSQPEQIFGHRPEHFTQFVGDPFAREGWHHPVFESKHGFPEKKAADKSSPMFNQHPPQEQSACQNTAKTQSQQGQPVSSEPKNKPDSTHSSEPIQQIQNIQKDVSELLLQVDQFSGAHKDKNYLYLDEMLTRNLLKLDNIDTRGQDSIRTARKEAIKCIEKAIGLLEAKAVSNSKKEESMEVDASECDNDKPDDVEFASYDSSEKAIDTDKNVQPEGSNNKEELDAQKECLTNGQNMVELQKSDGLIPDQCHDEESSQSSKEAGSAPIEEDGKTTEKRKNKKKKDN